jgi:hypothetical protein
MSEFYLRDSRSNVGSTCMFWAKDGCGYTSNLDKAERYTLEQAQWYINSRETDIPLSVALVDQVTTIRVDHQVIDTKQSGLNDECNQYVLHVHQGDYDGNDIYWKSPSSHSVNLREALVLTLDEAIHAQKLMDGVGIYPLIYALSIGRRTLQASNINERRMITAAGIRKPKRRRQRPTSGRTRGNCPHCGKVTWGFNPYEAYSCAEAANEKLGWQLHSSCSSVPRASEVSA